MDSKDKHIMETLDRIQNEITSTIEELSSIKLQMDKQVSEESNRVFKFIFNLQRSGFSQEFKPCESIEKHFGFSKETSEKYLLNYIEQLSELTSKFSKTANLDTYISLENSETNSYISDSQQKKRKGPKPYSEMTPEELATAKAKKLERAKVLSQETPNIQEVVIQEAPVIQDTLVVKKEKRILKTKKTRDGIKIWNSFLKIVKAEMESSGVSVSYDDLVKKAREMKEEDKSAYELFSATWTPDDESSPSNA